MSCTGKDGCYQAWLIIPFIIIQRCMYICINSICIGIVAIARCYGCCKCNHSDGDTDDGFVGPTGWMVDRPTAGVPFSCSKFCHQIAISMDRTHQAVRARVGSRFSLLLPAIHSVCLCVYVYMYIYIYGVCVVSGPDLLSSWSTSSCQQQRWRRLLQQQQHQALT